MSYRRSPKIRKKSVIKGASVEWDVLGVQQRASQCEAVAPPPGLLALPVFDSVLVVHHLLEQCLIVGVQRSHGDVPHRPELTAVVQVLVLQTEEVPHETPTTHTDNNTQ